ncbi:MAG: ABC transporter ATP-binding protein [Bacteroidales bacterium]|nr:ABC transporter ATP-binding protein [Bacteroidales bacterium]
MFRLINVQKEYDTGKHKIHALAGISLQIPCGKAISIVGKSGCGKSTLLNLLGGLDRPTFGNVVYKGTDIATLNQQQLAGYRKSAVGMVFQSFNLIHSLSAWENVAIALAIGNVPRRKRKAEALNLLSQVGLDDRACHLPAELSGGECQRVAIARALANSPDVILADEPTGNLDSETSFNIMELLTSLNKINGKTLIMVTHDIDYARKFSDLIITLKDGQIISQS